MSTNIVLYSLAVVGANTIIFSHAIPFVAKRTSKYFTYSRALLAAQARVEEANTEKLYDYTEEFTHSNLQEIFRKITR